MQRRYLIKGLLSATALAVSGNLGALNTTSSSAKYSSDIEPMVLNSGIGGNNSTDLLTRIDSDCLAHNPKLTIVMAGTNDMNSKKHVDIRQYEKNLLRILQKIKGVGSDVLMMTILPVYEPYLLTRHNVEFYNPEGPSGRRKIMNEVIKKVCKTESVGLLDIGHRFERIGKIGTDRDSLIRNEANSNQTDGIHPTSNGYRFIALAVYDYIVDHLLPQTEIVCFGDSITYGNGSTDSYPGYLKCLLTE